ncbi:unnamed protein product [Prorocentrum cordatum]|uniref:Uncharacterized protein n=1 Tax=Prorocentrum cordatum TaxID=2364126 RepID=A0ABN9SAC8_9DINO|nr:unnamed protein product [Polarella glacialis]
MGGRPGRTQEGAEHTDTVHRRCPEEIGPPSKDGATGGGLGSEQVKERLKNSRAAAFFSLRLLPPHWAPLASEERPARPSAAVLCAAARLRRLRAPAPRGSVPQDTMRSVGLDLPWPWHGKAKRSSPCWGAFGLAPLLLGPARAGMRGRAAVDGGCTGGGRGRMSPEPALIRLGLAEIPSEQILLLMSLLSVIMHWTCAYLALYGRANPCNSSKGASGL